MPDLEKPAGSKSPSKRGRPRKATNGDGPHPDIEVPMSAEPTPTEAPPQQETPNAVLVIKNIGEDGSLNIDVQTMGEIQVTEVQTLLELGVGSFRNRIGLGVKAS